MGANAEIIIPFKQSERDKVTGIFYGADRAL
jgi:hypothetical protein